MSGPSTTAVLIRRDLSSEIKKLTPLQLNARDDSSTENNAKADGAGDPHPTQLGKYRIESFIAEGGTAWVFRGYDTLLDKDVAIKALKPSIARLSPEVVERFKREALIARELEHPAIVAVYDLAFDSGYYYISMELLSGVTIHDLIHQRTKLQERLALMIISDLCECLGYMASQGVVHRDLKPANIHLSREQEIRIVDFGLAKRVDTSDVEDITMRQQSLGTPHYMAPEQILDSRSVDFRSDMYSLGVCLFQMLAGNVPFDRKSSTSVLQAQLADTPPSVEQLNKHVHPSTSKLVARLLKKKPVERFRDYKELLLEVQTCIAEVEIAEGNRR